MQKMSKQAHDRKMKWWREARFGMFIHWGLYAIPAGTWKGKEISGIGEWIMRRARIPAKTYEKLATSFNPTKFDAEAWVKLAVDAGMKYLTITSKHHDGFAIFHSEASGYNIVDATPFGRDPVAELAKACKNAGIKLCFYYSQKQDWHHPDASGNAWDYPSRPDKNFNRYMREKALPQVREILTQYGPVGMIWYDTPQDITAAQTKRFVKQVYDVQPNCIVNGRAGHGIGDYQSMGDNLIPPGRVDGDWETPATLNDTWAYKTNDHNWKDLTGLIHRMVDIVSKGGNYLLNIGPKADGTIPPASVKLLKGMGQWMSLNGEAVHGAGASPSPFEQSWGAITSKRDRLYLNVVDWPSGKLILHGLQSKVKRAYLLQKADKDLKVLQTQDPESGVDHLEVQIPKKAPNRHVSVIVLETRVSPIMDQVLNQEGDGRVLLESFHAAIHTPTRGRGASPGRWGTVENWFNKENRVSWDFRLASPGRYMVQVITQTDTSGRWEGGHDVRVNVGRSSVRGKLREVERRDNPRANSYLLDVVSTVGTIVINKAGVHTLKLKAEQIVKKKGMGLKLRGVQLIPAN
jgi:alpha-L-fucosidase